MATGQPSARLTVPQLMRTVKQLAPAELCEFKRRFAQWQEHNGSEEEEERALVEACKARLPAADERRLKKLIGKRERHDLGPDELEEYRALVRRAESLDAARLTALTQLARRWGEPVRVVMATIGWEAPQNEAASHPPRRAKAGARARR
jgi:hypothetical protein